MTLLAQLVDRDIEVEEDGEAHPAKDVAKDQVVSVHGQGRVYVQDESTDFRPVIRRKKSQPLRHPRRCAPMRGRHPSQQVVRSDRTPHAPSLELRGRNLSVWVGAFVRIKWMESSDYAIGLDAW